jgi:hypothetical protein
MMGLVPRHRGFDWLGGHVQDGEIVGRNEHFDAASRAGLAANEACAFKDQDHLVDRRRSDAETVLDIGFGGRPQVDARVGVDEGEVLPLGGCEGGFVFARHLIHLSIRLRLRTGGGDERTLSCDPDPRRAR